MPKTLIFTKRGPHADHILAAFSERTGLGTTVGDDRAIFQLEGAGHEIGAAAELDAVDPGWREQLTLENPQT
jgi:hypothetical protein